MAFEEGPHLERVKRRDNRRWPLLAIGLGVVLVVLAALQPWTANAPDPVSRTRTADGGSANRLTLLFKPDTLPGPAVVH